MSSEFVAIGVSTKMTVRKNSHHLQITRRWFEIKDIFLAPVVIAWDAFIFYGYIMIFSATKIDIFAALFLLLHAALGICLTYGLLAGFLNKTTIDVTFNIISVKHSPLPFGRNKRIAVKELLWLYCKKEKIWIRFRWITTFSVHAVMNNGNNITLLSGLNIAKQALFIEQEVRNFLYIKDESVKG